MDQVITLNRNDDILKVHSKVEWSDGRRVILVVPRGCKALDSEHELRLLRRWADSSDLPVALISKDIELKELAASSGLPLFPSVESAARSNWHWNRNGASNIGRGTALDDKPIAPKRPILDSLGLAGVQLFVTVLFFALVAILLLGFTILLVPSARITVVPAAVNATDAREVILDPNVTIPDVTNNILPANAVREEITGTATLATSKVTTAPADHASGTVVFTNLSGAPTTIPLGTVVETSSGVTIRFTTTVAAQLSSGYNSRATVPVKAVDPGPVGNVRALQINTIEGPLSPVARVINLSQTGGGTIKQVHIVSADDKENLRKKLNDQLRLAAVADMQNQYAEHAIVPAASVQVVVSNEAFDHLVDDPTDTLTLHVSGLANALVVDEADLNKFGQTVLAEKIPSGYSIVPGSLNVSSGTESRVEGTSVIIRVTSRLSSMPPVSSGTLLKGLAGLSPSNAAQELAKRIKLARPPSIQVSPSWWPRMPFFDFRIALFIQ